MTPEQERIIAGLVRPLTFQQSAYRASDEFAHGAGTMYALSQDHDGVIAAMIEGSFTTKAAFDGMEQARAWANSKERARIAAALDVDKIVALVGALRGLIDRYDEVVTTPDCSCGQDDHDVQVARAALAAFRGDPT